MNYCFHQYNTVIINKIIALLDYTTDLIIPHIITSSLMVKVYSTRLILHIVINLLQARDFDLSLLHFSTTVYGQPRQQWAVDL